MAAWKGLRCPKCGDIIVYKIVPADPDPTHDLYPVREVTPMLGKPPQGFMLMTYVGATLLWRIDHSNRICPVTNKPFVPPAEL